MTQQGLKNISQLLYYLGELNPQPTFSHRSHGFRVRTESDQKANHDRFSRRKAGSSHIERSLSDSAKLTQKKRQGQLKSITTERREEFESEKQREDVKMFPSIEEEQKNGNFKREQKVNGKLYMRWWRNDDFGSSWFQDYKDQKNKKKKDYSKWLRWDATWMAGEYIQQSRNSNYLIGPVF